MPSPPSRPDHDLSDRASLLRWTTPLSHWLVRWARAASRSVSSHGVLAISATVGGILIIVLTAGAAEIYDAVSEGEGIAAVDRPVLDAAIDRRNAPLDRALTVFTHLGGPLGMTVIAASITALMLWRWRSRTPLILMLITVAGSLTMTLVGKRLVGRLRPPQGDAVPPYETSPSFPSGHALNSTAIAGMVAYLLLLHLERRLARTLTVLLALGWALAIGASRVFLGHHWLTDVMMGWATGLAWLAVVVTAHRLFLTVTSASTGPQDAGG